MSVDDSDSVLNALLSKYWGYDTFRPGQKEVVSTLLAGDDAMVLMATGSGKSLCYQIPALARRAGIGAPSGSAAAVLPDGGRRAVTVVVSPLISLMEDQVLHCTQQGIPAAFVGSAQTDVSIERRALGGEFVLLYATPELCNAWLGRGFLPRLHASAGVALFAVDEAHCVSEWGHDFRPDYRQLQASLRGAVPGPPVVALTATATPQVRAEVEVNLGLREPLLRVATSFNRPNLHYRAEVKRGAAADLGRALGFLGRSGGSAGGSTIIYTSTKKEAEALAAQAAAPPHSLKAAAYHAGMTATERARVHHAFVRDELQVVVATVAFGMGIDKPDVRLVVHYGLPKTIEGYYQQTGRAGRDGLSSRCVLFWNRGDLVTLGAITSKDGGGEDGGGRQRQVMALVQQMQALAAATDCRRSRLLTYFGENEPPAAASRGAP